MSEYHLGGLVGSVVTSFPLEDGRAGRAQVVAEPLAVDADHFCELRLAQAERHACVRQRVVEHFRWLNGHQSPPGSAVCLVKVARPVHPAQDSLEGLKPR